MFFFGVPLILMRPLRQVTAALQQSDWSALAGVDALTHRAFRTIRFLSRRPVVLNNSVAVAMGTNVSSQPPKGYPANSQKEPTIEPGRSIDDSRIIRGEQSKLSWKL